MTVSYGNKGTKRLTDPLPSDQSPDSKRPKVAANPISKTSSVSPALPSARIPPNQRSQPPVASQVTHPPSTTVSGQNTSSAQPVHAATSVPASTPVNASPSVAPPPSGASMLAPNRELLDQVVPTTGLKFGQLMERLQALDREIEDIDVRIANAQNAGQTAILNALQKERAGKVHVKDQIKILLWQYFHKMRPAKESQNAPAGTAGSALPNGLADAVSSTQSHPPNVPSASSERLTASTTEEHKPVVAPDSHVVAQFWQSRGGTISTPSGGHPQAGPSQVQSHPTVTPEIAPQVPKPIEMKGTRPQSFGPSSQTSGAPSHETSVNPNTTNNQLIQTINSSTWYGTFSGTFPKLSGQATNEVQIHVVGMFTPPTQSDV